MKLNRRRSPMVPEVATALRVGAERGALAARVAGLRRSIAAARAAGDLNRAELLARACVLVEQARDVLGDPPR